MRILFIPSLGKGYGHIKRALLIIAQLKKCDEDIEVSMIIDHAILSIVDCSSFMPIVIPEKISNISQELSHSNYFPNVAQYQRLILNIINYTRPDVVVYDFVISEPVYELVQSYGASNVLILREQKKKYIDYLLSSRLADYFEKILIPHDKKHFNLIDTMYQAKTVNVGPLFDRNINYNKIEVRSKFNINPDDIWIIATCGGGGFPDEVENMLNTLDFALSSFQKNVKCTFFKGIYSVGNIEANVLKEITIHNFDPQIPSYYYSADIIVSFAGYNSFHEILFSNKTAILIPAKRYLDDQVKRTEEFAQATSKDIISCSSIKEASIKLIELIERFQNGYTPKNNAINWEEDGAHIAARELSCIAPYRNKPIVIPNDAKVLSQYEIENIQDEFEKYYSQGITKFYLNRSDINSEVVNSISLLEDKKKELNLIYDLHLNNNQYTQDFISGSNQLTHVNLRITQKCNSRCVFCYHWMQTDDDRNMPYLKIIDIVNQARKLGAKYIVLNGGEPTLHDDFFKILDALTEQGYSITINTNGLKLHSSSFLNRLKKYENITLMITILSVNDVGLRGVPDWSSKTIDLIKLLKKDKHSFNIKTNIVLNRNNYQQLHLITNKLFEADVNQLIINFIDSVSNIDSAYLYLNKQQIKEFYFYTLPKLYFKAYQKNIIVKINPLFMRTCFNYVVKKRTKIWQQIIDLVSCYYNADTEIQNFTAGLYGKHFYNKLKYCHVPNGHIYIMTNGDVYPCLKAIGSLKHSTYGNLYYRTMDSIIQSKEWKKYRDCAGNYTICEMCNNAFISNLENVDRLIKENKALETN